MRYAQAVTDERAKYRQEQKAICNGRITARPADGALMTPTQAFEDAQARYVDACAPIIAQAYHDGDYDGFWQALSNATHTDNFIYYKNAAFQIIEQTIILTGLLDHDISDGALHDTSFMRAVARDTIKNSDDHPNGVHRLFGRLYDWGDFNALKTSNPSFTAARNTVALGSRIMEELANTVTNDEELINNALKLCAPTGLAEHAYLAGADNSDDNILSRIGRKNFHETTSNFMVTSASYGIVYALCGDVQGAAARWRSIISDAETNRDEAREIEARCAHMKLCGALMERGALPADDLATLIDTFEATSLMKVKTLLFGGSIEPRNMRIRDRNASGTNVRDIYTDIIKVEELIDMASSRMEAGHK